MLATQHRTELSLFLTCFILFSSSNSDVARIAATSSSPCRQGRTPQMRSAWWRVANQRVARGKWAASLRSGGVVQRLLPHGWPDKIGELSLPTTTPYHIQITAVIWVGIPKWESLPNRYSALCWRPVTGLQHSALYRFRRFAPKWRVVPPYLAISRNSPRYSILTLY